MKRNTRAQVDTNTSETTTSTMVTRSEPNEPEPPKQQQSVRASKIPKFWEEYPEGWTNMAAASLNADGIRDEKMRYWTLVRSLTQAATKAVQELISKPFQPGFEKELLRQLKENFDKSKDKRLNELLQGKPNLSHLKPSQRMQHFKSLRGTDLVNEVSEFVLERTWIDSLNPSVKGHILAKGDATLDEKIKLADTLEEFLQAGKVDIAAVEHNRQVIPYLPSTSAVQPPNLQPPNLQPPTAHLHCCDVHTAHAQQWQRKPRPHFQKRRNYTGKSPAAAQSTGKRQHFNGICYYHYNFGIKATKCDPPCVHGTISKNVPKRQ